MTEQELREIEDTANAVTPNPGHLITVLAHKDIPALVAEVRRLKGLIKQVETVDCYGPQYNEDGCPFCHRLRFSSAPGYHEDNCQAFTPEGELK